MAPIPAPATPSPWKVDVPLETVGSDNPSSSTGTGPWQVDVPMSAADSAGALPAFQQSSRFAYLMKDMQARGLDPNTAIAHAAASDPGRQYWGNSCAHAVNDHLQMAGINLQERKQVKNKDWVPDYANVGQKVSDPAAVKPGDLIIYNTKEGYDHIGIASEKPGHAWNVSSAQGHKWAETPYGGSFQEARRLTDVTHGLGIGSLPQGGTPGTKKMPSGRDRSASNVNDMIIARCADPNNNIDRPDIVARQFNQESNYTNDVEKAKKVQSSAGAVGIPQFTLETLQPILDKKHITLEQYLNDENIQIKLGTEYMAERLKVWKNYPQALAAYNAGDGGVQNIKDGKGGYSETINYVSKILQISPEQALQAIKTGQTPDGKGQWQPLATEKMKNENFSPTVSTLGQMARNIAPWLASKDGTVFGAHTVDDSEFATSNAADMMRSMTLGLSSMWARPDDDYMKWKDSGGKMWQGFNFVTDNLASLPVMSMFAELAAPRMLAPLFGTAEAAGGATAVANGAGGFRVVGQATKGLLGSGGAPFGWTGRMLGAEALAEGLVKAQAAGTLSKPMNGFVNMLKSTGSLPDLLKWMTTFGVYHMNDELGRSMQQEGKSFQEAVPAALAAGMHGAISSMLPLIMMPVGMSVGAGAVKGLLGVGNEIGSSMFNAMKMGESELFKKLPLGGIVNTPLAAMGPGIAEWAENQWNKPSFAPKKAVLVAAAEKMYSMLDAAHRTTVNEAVQRSAETAQHINDINRDVSSKTQAATAINSAVDTFTKSQDTIKYATDRAEAKVGEAARDYQSHRKVVDQLKQTNPLLDYVNKQELIQKSMDSQIEQIKAQQQTIQDAIDKRNPKDPKNGWDAKKIKNLDIQISAINQRQAAHVQKMDRIEQQNGPLLQQYTNLKDDLQAKQDALQAAAKDDIYVNRAHYRQIAEGYSPFIEGHKLRAQQIAEALTDREAMQIPDISRSKTLDPVIPAAWARQGLEGKLKTANLSNYHDALTNSLTHSLENFHALLPEELTSQIARVQMDMPGGGQNLQLLKSLQENLKTEMKTKPSDAVELQKHIDSLDNAIKAYDRVPEKAQQENIRKALGTKPTKEILEKFRDAGGDLSKLAPPGRVPEMMRNNPLTAVINRKTHAELGFKFMTNEFMPALEAAQRVFALNAEHGSAEIAMNEIGGQFSKMLFDQSVEHRMAFDTIVENRLKGSLDHPDLVWGAAAEVARDGASLDNASHMIASWAGKHVDEKMHTALDKIPKWKKWGSKEREDFMIGLRVAMENRAEMATLLEQYPQLAEPLSVAFTFQSAIERVKQFSPELKSWMRSDYARRIWPRIHDYTAMLGSMDAQAAETEMGKLSTWLTSEKARTVDEIRGALTEGKEAERRLAEKGMTYKEYLQLPSDKVRQERMSLPNIDEAIKLKHQILLGEITANPATLVYEQIRSTLRADALRHSITNLMGITDGATGGNFGMVHRIKDFYEGSENGTSAMEKFFKDPPRADVRVGSGFTQRKYQNLAQVPGMGNYFLQVGNEMVPAREFAIHPAAADYFHNYLSFKGSPNEFAKSFMSFWNTMRGLELATAAVPHAGNMFGSMMNAASWNPFRVMGFFKTGAEMANNPDMVGMAFRSGLNSTTYGNTFKMIGNDLLDTARKNGVEDELFAAGSKYQGAVGKMMSAINQKGIQPMLRIPEALMGGEKLINRVTLFKAISNAQLGGWAHWTAKIMQEAGPSLIAEHGSYEAAYLAAQKSAAYIMNKAAGAMPTWWFSSTSRALAQATMAPSLMMTKMEALGSSFNGLLSNVKGGGVMRDRNLGLSNSPAMQSVLNKQNRNFLWGSIVSSVVGAELLNYFVNPNSGLSTWSNPDDTKYMHVWLGKTPSGDTYITPPLFGMFRWLTHGVLGGIKEHSAMPLVQDILNQSHSLVRTLADVISNRGRPAMFGSQKPEVPYAFDSGLGDWRRFAFYNTFNTKSMPAPTNAGGFSWTGTDEYGNPQSAARFGMNLMGLNPTRPAAPYQRVTGKIKEGYDAEEALLKNKVSRMMDSWLDLGPNTAEGQAYWKQIVNVATVEGIPVTNSTLRAEFIRNGLHPEGHFVIRDPRTINAMVTQKMAPMKAAYGSAPMYVKAIVQQGILEAQRRREAYINGRKKQ